MHNTLGIKLYCILNSAYQFRLMHNNNWVINSIVIVSPGAKITSMSQLDQYLKTEEDREERMKRGQLQG